MTMMRGVLFVSLSLAILGGAGRGDEPGRSGPRPGQRPGPYSALVVVGPERGQQHCYICDAADRPVVIVFARTLTDPLGKLVRQLDRALDAHRSAELRAWVTFLAEDQAGLDPQVVAWAKRHAIGNVPLAVFEDPVGPPAYLLARDADVTVLVAARQKVLATFAYRAGELTDAAAADVLRAVAKAAGAK